MDNRWNTSYIYLRKTSSLKINEIHQRAADLHKLGEAKELPTIAELEKLWYTLQEEMTINGDIRSYQADVIAQNGETVSEPVTRLGVFNAINEKGLSPISDVLTTIGNISTQKDLTEVFGNAWLTGASSPINSGMWYNRLDPNEYQLSVGVGGLGLPDRDYYLSDDERFVKIREAYEAHIAQMLGFAKVENPEEKAAEKRAQCPAAAG